MKKRYFIMAAAVTASAFLQAFAMNVFLEPVQLLPSGFTGIAALLSRIAGAAGLTFTTSLGMVLLNLPVALFCYGHIGKKFVLFSMAQVVLASLFLRVIKREPLFYDVLLNICFGGFLYGPAVSVALKGSLHGRHGFYRPVCVKPAGKIHLAVCACIQLLSSVRVRSSVRMGARGLLHLVPVHSHQDHRQLLPPV